MIKTRRTSGRAVGVMLSVCPAVAWGLFVAGATDTDGRVVAVLTGDGILGSLEIGALPAIGAAGEQALSRNAKTINPTNKRLKI